VSNVKLVWNRVSVLCTRTQALMLNASRKLDYLWCLYCSQSRERPLHYIYSVAKKTRLMYVFWCCRL